MNEGDTRNVSTLVQQLSAEVGQEGNTAAGGATRSRRREPDASEQLGSVVDDISPYGDLRFDEELVKQNLEELLLMLIAMQDEGSHGKRLMNDLSRVFDARLSPGTVYPSLHELEDEDVLAMFERVRTKEYEIDDLEEAKFRMEDAMYQHLALGFMFYVALGEM